MKLETAAYSLFFSLCAAPPSSATEPSPSDDDPRVHPLDDKEKPAKERVDFYFLKTLPLESDGNSPWVQGGLFLFFPMPNGASLEFGLELEPSESFNRSDASVWYKTSDPMSFHGVIGMQYQSGQLTQGGLALGISGPLFLDDWKTKIDMNQWSAIGTYQVGSVDVPDSDFSPKEYSYGIKGVLSLGPENLKVRIEPSYDFLVSHSENDNHFEQEGNGSYLKIDASVTWKLYQSKDKGEFALFLQGGVTADQLNLIGTFTDGKKVEIHSKNISLKLGMVLLVDNPFR